MLSPIGRWLRRPKSLILLASLTLLSCPTAAGSTHQTLNTGSGRIVFQRFDFSNNAFRPFLSVADPDGSHIRRLTWRGQSGDPRWSPNGRRIAYTHSGDVWVMRADGSHRRKLLAGARMAAWSPTGKRLLVHGVSPDHSSYTFGIFDFEGNGSVNWYPLGGSIGVARAGDWSWSTNRIAFSGAADSDASADLYTVTPDLTGLRQVTDTPRLNEIQPRWSPTGPRRLVYVAQDCFSSAELGCTDVAMVLQLETKVKQAIHDDAGRPTWSPSGNQVLLVHQLPDESSDDNSELLKVDLRTGRETVVVPSSQTYFASDAPDWRSR